ncbi:iron-containing alcohol dehydrogenase family protein [Nocardioides sp.]|uniref:iron-containing alcohol dehydrogenase family protein n=1 Tax=Nocardioides sp. TaxID=35761 RepID=UPI0031FE909F|nr:3-dehydroquinate synthase [Nocardioides sp.]
MPLLARMLASPLFLDIRAGAVDDLPRLLQDRHISTTGNVLVAVGPLTGQDIWTRIEPSLPGATMFSVQEGSLAAAAELQAALGERGYDAVVAIGGGRTLDVAKYAATRAGIPMIAVATNLAHDGLCSPVASLEHPHGKGSFGVALPLAVVVDLDYVKQAPDPLVAAGIGDVASNLSAIEDWLLAGRERNEPVDGLAMAFARTAAEAVIRHTGSIDDETFLVVLAEALVLSGMAMSVAGTSRPCSGACHEILHAIDQLFPGAATHGELAGLGAAFATHLRGDQDRFAELITCLARHELPCVPADVGLSEEQFVSAVLAAPDTRPDRYTILEHLALDAEETTARVRDFVAAVDEVQSGDARVATV